MYCLLAMFFGDVQDITVFLNHAHTQKAFAYFHTEFRVFTQAKRRHRLRSHGKDRVHILNSLRIKQIKLELLRGLTLKMVSYYSSTQTLRKIITKARKSRRNRPKIFLPQKSFLFSLFYRHFLHAKKNNRFPFFFMKLRRVKRKQFQRRTQKRMRRRLKRQMARKMVTRWTRSQHRLLLKPKAK